MFVPIDHGVLARFHFSGGKPSTVETWVGSSRKNSSSVAAGIGKHILEAAERTHPSARTIPNGVAKTFAEATGACLLCGKPLSSAASLKRGFGDECASKVR